MIKHFTREDFTRRLDQMPYTVEVEVGAYDPETGDTLIGPVTVTYQHGEFPRSPYLATIEDA